MKRRTCMLLLGLAWLAGNTGCAAPASTDPMQGAAARIEENRKAPFVITVVRDGEPVFEASVQVNLRRHAFLFGCNGFEQGLHPAYDEQFAAIFNFMTLRNQPSDFAAGAPQGSRVAEAIAFAKTHGITLKSGALANPSDAWPAKMKTPAEFAAAVQLVQTQTHAMQGKLDVWDVVNEFANWQGNPSPELATLTKTEIMRQSLLAARAGNPKATCITNDYDTGDKYPELLRALQEPASGKALFDVVGQQLHMHDGTKSNAEIWRIVDRLAEFGKPVHITETTILSNTELEALWREASAKGEAAAKDSPSTAEGEAHQAKELERVYTLLFSHPAVQAISWWDFSDEGSWFGAPAGLLRADKTAKPAYDTLKRLVTQTWSTNERLQTNAQGQARLRAFLGDYTLTVTLPDGSRQSFDATVEPGENAVMLEVGS